MIAALSELINNYKTKIRNPLIGTISGVWIIHNWKVVYALFNFDENFTMEKKISYIEDYFGKKHFWCEFLTIIGSTFAVIIVTFILLAISRFLTDLYFRIAEPYIKGRIDSKEIFNRKDKQKLETDIKNLEKNVTIYRNDVNTLDNQNTNLQNRIDFLIKTHDTEVSNLKGYLETSRLQYSNLENSAGHSKKVLDYFDDIIKGLDDSMKSELNVYVKNQGGENLKHSNYVGLKTQLIKIGVIVEFNGVTRNTELGLMFLEYFKFWNENNNNN